MTRRLVRVGADGGLTPAFVADSAVIPVRTVRLVRPVSPAEITSDDDLRDGKVARTLTREEDTVGWWPTSARGGRRSGQVAA